MVTLYGIKNCDTVKKATNWLDSHDLSFQFHDLRADGLSQQQVQNWADQLGWETLLNKRSTTWKNLDAQLRENMDAATAIATMVQYPTLIKRPVLEYNDHLQVGFKPQQYSDTFQR